MTHESRNPLQPVNLRNREIRRIPVSPDETGGGSLPPVSNHRHPPAGAPPVTRRERLASLLWGEPEEDVIAPPPPAAPPPLPEDAEGPRQVQAPAPPPAKSSTRTPRGAAPLPLRQKPAIVAPREPTPIPEEQAASPSVDSKAEDFVAPPRTDSTDAMPLPPPPPAIESPASRVLEVPALDQPTPAPQTAAVTTDPSGTGSGGSIAQRATLRRACSFPGLIRVLLPEESFQPQVLAVRVVDVSPGGARLETRQMTPVLEERIMRERRYMRLEVMLPTSRRIISAGKIVWAEHAPEMSFVGVQFDRETRDFDECFVENVGEDTYPELVCLPSPQLDPFPSTTNRLEVEFAGSAPGAKTVLCRLGKREFNAEVVNGRFHLKVKLQPNLMNFAAVTAMRDTVSSIPTPVCVVHAPDAKDTISFHNSSILDTLELSPDGDMLKARFAGDARRFFPVLRKISETLVCSEEVTIEIELKGDARKAEEVLRVLRQPPK